jgi:hypothetical protein
MRRSSQAEEPIQAEEPPRAPTPSDLAERGGTFAMTAAVHEPVEPAAVEPAAIEPAMEPAAVEPAAVEPAAVENGFERADVPETPDRAADDAHAERGLRGLVGGGSSQVSVGAALRARDAARPTEADLAAAETELLIVRRGWVPREDLPPRGPRR